MDEPLPDRCQVTAWRPPVSGIAEVFHARIVNYGYPVHCHDTWTVLIVDGGAISYQLDKRQCGAVGSTVAVLPPGVAHNGDLELRSGIALLHDQLAMGEAEAAEQTLSTAPLTATAGSDADVAAARQVPDERPADNFTLSDAAETLGRSKAHLVRSFSASYGISPYAYLIARQVEVARGLLLDGRPPAEVAVEAGFYDQAHFTRHFKRHTSASPGAYQKSFEPI